MPAGKQKRSRAGLIAALVLAVLLAGGFAVYQHLQRPVDPDGGEVVFEVPEGAGPGEVIRRLKQQGLIRNEAAAKLWYRLNGQPVLYAGRYHLSASQSLPQIFAVLSDESQIILDTVTVTIVPGDWAKDVAAKLAEATNLNAGDIMTRWNDMAYMEELMGRYPFLTEEIFASEHCYLEGYLAPDTYTFYAETTIGDVTEKILDQSLVLYQQLSADIAESSLSIHQLVTLASIVQYEAATAEDMGLVSGVLYNRLNDGWVLGCSATVCYALYDDFHDWTDCESNPDLDSPYNTYRYRGLPVGPVCNPSATALNAALHPTENDYYYFMADVATGKIYYARTYAEHEQNIAEHGS